VLTFLLANTINVCLMVIEMTEFTFVLNAGGGAVYQILSDVQSLLVVG
jgi:hypothetical protein